MCVNRDGFYLFSDETMNNMFLPDNGNLEGYIFGNPYPSHPIDVVVAHIMDGTDEYLLICRRHMVKGDSYFIILKEDLKKEYMRQSSVGTGRIPQYHKHLLEINEELASNLFSNAPVMFRRMSW
jgi:hypothetical protein